MSGGPVLPLGRGGPQRCWYCEDRDETVICKGADMTYPARLSEGSSPSPRPATSSPATVSHWRSRFATGRGLSKSAIGRI